MQTHQETQRDELKEELKKTQRTNALKKALVARSQMTATPRERHEEKVTEALKWLLVWGMSSSEILCLMTASTNRAFLATMTKNKWARTVKVMGQNFYMLTTNGKKMVDCYLADEDKTKQLGLIRSPFMWAWHHSEWCQRVLALKIKALRSAGDEFRWMGDRQLRQAYNNENDKSPDAALWSSSGVVFIEIENTPKKRAEIEVMLSALCDLMEKRGDKAFAEIHIKKSHSSAYIKVYSEWRAGHWHDWAKGANGSLYISGRYECSQERLLALDRIKFIWA